MKLRIFIPWREYPSFLIRGFVGFLVLVAIVCIFMLPTMIKTSNHNKEVNAKIESNTPDYVFGDVSELCVSPNGYDAVKKYDEKVVQFTGIVSWVSDTDFAVSGENNGKEGASCSVLGECLCAGHYYDRSDYLEEHAPLKEVFHEGDKVVVTGEVTHSQYSVCVTKCTIQHAS